MSASASKKKRKELNEQGLSVKELAVKKASDEKKKKLRTGLLIALVAVVAIGIVIGTIAILNNRYTQTVATVGDEKISIPVYNCFYNNCANSICSYLSQFGLVEADVPFSKQSNPMGGDGTLEDYLIEYTNSYLTSYYALYAESKKDSGYKLSQDGKNQISDALASVKSEATEHGYPSADKYLQALMGRGVTLDDYETYLTVYITASEYDSYLQESFNPSEEELATEYDANPENYDTVFYTTSTTNAVGTVDKDSEDKDMTYTDEAKAEAKAAAEAKKDNMPEDATHTKALKSDVANEELAAWLFDASRKAGDTEVFSTNDAGTTYQTVRFDSRDTNDYSRVKAYVISITKDTPTETEPAETEPTETEPAETEPAETEPAETEPAETEPAETEPAETEPAETEPAETEPAETEPAETEPAETEPADDKSDEEKKETSEEKLEKLLDGITAEMTDEDFETYASDLGYTASVRTLAKGDTVDEVDAYVYDAARKAGDFTSIDTDKTYYVVRFVGTQEDSYRTELVKNALYSRMYTEMMGKYELNMISKAMKYLNTNLTLHSSAS